MGVDLVKLGLMIIFSGFVGLLLVTILAFMLSAGGRVKGAGVVMVGPVPIVFGDVKLVKPLMIIAVVLMVLGLLLSLGLPLVWRWC